MTVKCQGGFELYPQVRTAWTRHNQLPRREVLLTVLYLMGGWYYSYPRCRLQMAVRCPDPWMDVWYHSLLDWEVASSLRPGFRNGGAYCPGGVPTIQGLMGVPLSRYWGTPQPLRGWTYSPRSRDGDTLKHLDLDGYNARVMDLAGMTPSPHTKCAILLSLILRMRSVTMATNRVTPKWSCNTHPVATLLISMGAVLLASPQHWLWVDGDSDT